MPNPAFKADVPARAFGWGQAYIDQQSTQRQSPPAERGDMVEAADYGPARVKVTWVTPLGEEVASIW